jgi:hypothetical protein
MIELDRENQSKNGHAQIKCRELPRSTSAGTNQTREIISAIWIPKAAV